MDAWLRLGRTAIGWKVSVLDDNHVTASKVFHYMLPFVLFEVILFPTATELNGSGWTPHSL